MMVERAFPLTYVNLLPQRLFRVLASGIQLPRRSQKFVTTGDELGIFRHKHLARGTQIEIGRIVRELLAVNATPNQSAIGVDVDLADTPLGRRQVLLGVDAFGAFQISASRVDASNLILRNGG